MAALRPPDPPASYEACFPSRPRRIGVIYVCATLPVVVLIGGLAHGQSQYILAFVVLAAGPYTTPALVLATLAIRRLPRNEQWMRAVWLFGLVLTYIGGLSLVIGVATGWSFANRWGIVLVVLVAMAFTCTVMGLVRSRSGRRALSVDLIEWLMSVVVLAAPAVLLWGDSVVSAEDAWFTIPAGVATIATISGLYWGAVLFLRAGPDRRPFEVKGLLIALVLELVGLSDTAVQTAQGVSDFTLPSLPLIAVHASCMSLLLLIPLFLPSRRSMGFNRLPPQAQVRGAGLVAVVTLVGLPVLGLVTLAERDEHAWASGFSFGVVVVLLVLAALRHLAGVRETRRLYSLVEKASADRRELIAHMIQRIDDDRHAVAAQLHEQAISAYATFVSFAQAAAPTAVRAGHRGSVDGASALVRRDLARQAEALRQLMLASRPLEAERSRSPSLATPVLAYLMSLYGDHRAPEIDVVVDPELVLDWITETIVLRIVHEALNNVWRHSEATHVRVSLRAGTADGDLVEVSIEDDGVGYDPEAALFESGIDAMRTFAAFADGRLEVDSAPGEGTVVVARLGHGSAASPDDGDPPGSPGSPGSDGLGPGEPDGPPVLRLV
jgi:signal transduction histidine kinase